MCSCFFRSSKVENCRFWGSQRRNSLPVMLQAIGCLKNTLHSHMAGNITLIKLNSKVQNILVFLVSIGMRQNVIVSNIVMQNTGELNLLLISCIAIFSFNISFSLLTH